LNAALADAILVVHAAFVLFVVGGLVATWIGLALGFPFARNPWFRNLHLAAIAFVVLESLLGMMCPLTVWEYQLRGEQSEAGFIQRWVHALLFWSWPAWVFTAIYVAFGLLVALTWWRFPPRR
jgi:sterol desaturase/sphingolipid hydroxylase (fatty acid hydroxylase superfamily)